MLPNVLLPLPLGLLEGSLLGRFAGTAKFAGTDPFAGAAAFAAALTGVVTAPLPLCHCCLCWLCCTPAATFAGGSPLELPLVMLEGLPLGSLEGSSLGLSLRMLEGSLLGTLIEKLEGSPLGLPLEMLEGFPLGFLEGSPLGIPLRILEGSPLGLPIGISLKFIGALTSCLFDALILLSIRPLPWVRTSWRVRWRFLCSAALIGLTSEKAKGKWLLGMLPLDQRKVPAYMFAVYPVAKLTLFIPLVSNC